MEALRRVLAMALPVVLAGCGPPPVANLTADQVTRVETRVFFEGTVYEAAATEDPAAIHALLAAAKPAGPFRDGGASAGDLTLVRRSGRPVRVSLVPGHDKRFYGYCDGQECYRVERGPFLAALRRIGLTHLPLNSGQVPPLAEPPLRPPGPAGKPGDR